MRGVFVLGVVLVAAGVSLMTGWGTQAQTPNRAGLVVQFGDGSVQTYCIQFASPSITGYDLLQASGNLQVIYDTANSGLGAGVCKINNDGCNSPMEDCFCQCQGVNCVYWSYFHLLGDNTWAYSQVGASSHTLQHGSVDAWRWGAGTLTTAPPPPVYTFNQLCGTTGTATSTLSPTTTDTPSVTPTRTHTPTHTPTPAATDTPTLTPTRAQTPTPTMTSSVVQVQFASNTTALTANQCAIVNWRVTGPWTAVYLDNAIVQPEEQREFCPSQTQTWTLRAEYTGGVETRSLTLQVTDAVPTVAVTTRVAPPTTPPTATTPTPLSTAPLPVDGPAPVLATATPTSSLRAGLPAATTVSNGMAAAATVPPTSTAVTSSTPDGRIALAPEAPSDQGQEPSSAETDSALETGVSSPLLQYTLFVVILGLLGAAGVFLMWRRSHVHDT